MYEHMRNDLLLQLTNVFNANELNQITAALDKVACNYDISPKTTSLVVYHDDIKRMANMFLASKSLEGLSDKTINFYGNRLRIFFDHIEKDRRMLKLTTYVYFYINTKSKRHYLTEHLISLDKY